MSATRPKTTTTTAATLPLLVLFNLSLYLWGERQTAVPRQPWAGQLQTDAWRGCHMTPKTPVKVNVRFWVMFWRGLRKNRSQVEFVAAVRNRQLTTDLNNLILTRWVSLQKRPFYKRKRSACRICKTVLLIGPRFLAQ